MADRMAVAKQQKAKSERSGEYFSRKCADEFKDTVDRLGFVGYSADGWK